MHGIDLLDSMALHSVAVRRMSKQLLLLIGVIILSLHSPAAAGSQNLPSSSLNLDLVVLIDDSSSLQNDQLRLRAAKFLVDYLRVNATQAYYRVAIASFDDQVRPKNSVALRLLERDDSTIRDGIRSEPRSNKLRYTDFAPAFDFARDQLRPLFGSKTPKVVLLFTDGEPESPSQQVDSQHYFSADGRLASVVNELLN
jgi:hypothetical protein